MEAALQRNDRKLPSPLATAEAERIADALRNLHSALQAALPLLRDDSRDDSAKVKDQNDSAADSEPSSKTVSAAWLLNLCQTVPSELEPLQIARTIVEAAMLVDEAQQQAALFDALGASDQAMKVLMEVVFVLPEIRRMIRLEDLEVASHQAAASSSHAQLKEDFTMVDVDEERRQFLLREAVDAAQIAAIAQAEADAILGTTAGATGSAAATHTIVRTSEQRAIKFAEKAKRRAAQALQRAKDAGAILDESDLLSIDRTHLGDGGLVNRSNEEVWALQQSLLPEGSRQYYDSRGLPKDSIREVEGDMERVIIPAARRDEANLPARLKIADIMNSELSKAFEGTASLNPMQSATFEVAFHSRDNMMVCAPVSSSCRADTEPNDGLLTHATHIALLRLLCIVRPAQGRPTSRCWPWRPTFEMLVSSVVAGPESWM